jgi:hypothetical protein
MSALAMVEPDSADQLAESRRELRALLQPLTRTNAGSFPRSATMRWLMNSEGGALATVTLGALLLTKPPFALQMLRILPASAIVRLLLNLPRR